MKRKILFLCFLPALFMGAVLAQGGDAAKNKKSFDERLKALSKEDWDGKVKLAQWAQENGLAPQAKKLLDEVIKVKPDHEEARKLLGFVKKDGKWVPLSDAEKAREAEKEKEYKEKGYVKYKGQWVPAADVPYLDKGLIKNGDVWITKEEKEKIDKGYVLVDGEWIAPEEAENVKKGLYKVGGKWVTLEEADSFHSSWETPWKLQTVHFVLHTNLDHKTADLQKQTIEDTYNRLFEIFKTEMKEKPPIFLIATDKDYANFAAKAAGHHSSVWAGCIAENNPDRPGLVQYDKTFVPYYLSHAVAHVYIDRISKGGDVPAWFEEAVATYVSRYYTPDLKKWSIENLTKRGSLDPFKKFTDQFELSADAVDESQKLLLEVGLIAWHCLQGGNEKMKKAFLDAAASVPSGKKSTIHKAVDGVLSHSDVLEKELKALLKGN